MIDWSRLCPASRAALKVALLETKALGAWPVSQGWAGNFQNFFGELK